jgi:apolipoprotein N-acyltransferase
MTLTTTIFFASALAIGVLASYLLPKNTDTFEKLKSIKASQATFDTYITWLETQIKAIAQDKINKTDKKVTELIKYEVDLIISGKNALKEKAEKLLELDHETVPQTELKKAVTQLDKINV